MTIKTMIDAARQGNPAEFERALSSVVAEKLSQALIAKRAQVASSLLGLNESEDEDYEDEDKEEEEEEEEEEED